MSQVQGAFGAAHALQQWPYLQAAQSADATSASQHAGGSDGASQAFDPFAGLGGAPQTQSGSCVSPPFTPDTMSALIQAQEKSGPSGASGLSQHQQKVFSELDTDGDGSVTKAELETDFGAENKTLADFVMSKLDTDGDGAISQSEFAAGTTRGGGHHHHMHAGPPPGQDGQGTPPSELMSATPGASATSTSNSDGSTTTTIAYADGSKITLDSPAAANADNSANTNISSTTQANLLEQLIKLQAQLTAPPASTTAATTLAIG